MSSPFCRKRDEIENVIAAYREKIEAAERDLSAVAATLLFELNGEPEQFPAHLALGRFFKRAEIVGVCLEALSAGSPLNTRELALRVIAAKGLDQKDTVLRKIVAYRVVQTLTMAARRGKLRLVGKAKGVRRWSAS